MVNYMVTLMMIERNISDRKSLYTSDSDNNNAGRPGKPLKLVYLVIGIICLMLGIIGLIIPIIPGVLFLMAALYLLSRGSRRIKKFSEEHPHMRQMHQRMEQFGEVSLSDRCRLAGWMVIEAGVKSVQVLKNGTVRAVQLVSRKVPS